MPQRKAAIPADERVLDQQLGQLSAAEFLKVLGRAEIDQRALRILPDKKKYELWVDETGLPNLKVRDFIEFIHKEKKKLELEKLRIEDLKLAVEFEVDPTRRFVDPRVIEEIAARVADKLRGQG